MEGATVRDPDLAGFAARLAPQVDRLFRAGHAAARPLGGPLIRAAGLTSAGLLIDLRTILLSPAGATPREACAIERYVDPAGVRAMLAQHVGQGLLERRGERFVPADRGRELLLGLTAALGQGGTSLWQDRADEVEEAGALAERAVAAAAGTLPPDRFPAFGAVRRGYVPPDATPAAVIFR